MANSSVSAERPGVPSKTNLYLSTLFLAVNIGYFVLAPRIISIGGLHEPGGIFIFPFTFFLANVITETYGYRYMILLIKATLILFSIFTAGTFLSVYFTDVVYADSMAYETVFFQYPRLLAAICCATVCGFTLNGYIISRLKTRLFGRAFAIRSIASTSLGHLVFTFVWLAIYHLGAVPFSEILMVTACAYAWKMSFELIMTPCAAYMSSWIKEHDGADTFDHGYNKISLNF